MFLSEKVEIARDEPLSSLAGSSAYRIRWPSEQGGRPFPGIGNSAFSEIGEISLTGDHGKYQPRTTARKKKDAKDTHLKDDLIAVRVENGAEVVDERPVYSHRADFINHID
jgi:hypothetical protein